MKATRAVVVMFLLLSGCGGCERSSEPPGVVGGGSGRAAAPLSALRTPVATAGKIQVAPLQPNVAGRQMDTPRAAGEGGGAPPAEVPPAAGAEAEPGEEGDCLVVADANPDYGPPPLSVAFTAEAECNAGQPTYKWNFGDGSPASPEPNPSHTYTQAGEYTASVTVTGPGGATASDEIDITVEEGEAEPQ